MMKRAASILALALTALVAVNVFAESKKVMIDKVVAVVGNSVILYSDVDEVSKQILEMRRYYGYTSDRDSKMEALEELLLQKVLFNQAKIDSLELYKSVADDVEEHIGQMVERTGSVAALEEQFHRPIYEIRKIITEMLEEKEYASLMRRTLYSKVTITPGEVERYFKKIHKDSIPIIPIQYVYGQITKYPESTKEAKLRTREQLLEMRERIINGQRFDALAQLYSEDPGSAARGGEMDFTPLDRFEAPFAKALDKLKPGQVSEVIETVHGFHIAQLIEKRGNMYKARHILRKPKFTTDELQATCDKLDSLAVKIREDSITFEKAALEYSDDKYTKYNGGLASNIEKMEHGPYQFSAEEATTKHLKEDLAPDDVKALDKLQVGEVSEAFITQDPRENMLIKIVKLLEVIPSHPATLKDDFLRIEQLALQQKAEDEFSKWLDKKIEGMFIRIAPEFRKPEEFTVKGWLK